MTKADNWLEEIREESEAKGFARGFTEGFVQGFDKGLARGELQTRVKILTLVLLQRFGIFSEDIRRRIEGAETPQLDIWINYMIDAPSLYSVLDRAPNR